MRVCPNSIVNKDLFLNKGGKRDATAATPLSQPPKKFVKPTTTTPAAELATVEKASMPK